MSYKDLAPGVVYYVKDSVLSDHKFDFIVHCADCTDHTFSGTKSEALIAKYPYGNVYEERDAFRIRSHLQESYEDSFPEDLDSSDPVLVAIYSHIFGRSKPHRKHDDPDSAFNREQSFHKALVNFVQDYEKALENPKKTIGRLDRFIPHLDCSHNRFKKDSFVVAIPYRIGCGPSWGDWEQYKRILNQVAADTTTFVFVVCTLGHNAPELLDTSEPYAMKVEPKENDKKEKEQEEDKEEESIPESDDEEEEAEEDEPMEEAKSEECDEEVDDDDDDDDNDTETEEIEVDDDNEGEEDGDEDEEVEEEETDE